MTMNGLKNLYLGLLMATAMGISGCQTLTGGGQVSLLDPDDEGQKISTDLDAADFEDMAGEVSAKMLADKKAFKGMDELKISIGAVRNLTENERMRVNDIVGLIRQALLKDDRVRIFGSGESFYVIHTDLKSMVTSQDGAKQVDYELRFELYNFETNEYLGSWNAKKSYLQSARSLF